MTDWMMQIVSFKCTVEIINSIKKYEKELADDLTPAVDALFDQIEEIHKKYVDEVAACEKVLQRWKADLRYFDHQKYLGSNHSREIGLLLTRYRNWEKFSDKKVGAHL